MTSLPPAKGSETQIAATTLARLHEEFDALGMLSYHGAPWDHGNTTWYADLTKDDIEKLRALLRDAGELLAQADLDMAQAKQLLALAYDGFGYDSDGFQNGAPTNAWRVKVEKLGAWPQQEVEADV